MGRFNRKTFQRFSRVTVKLQKLLTLWKSSWGKSWSANFSPKLPVHHCTAETPPPIFQITLERPRKERVSKPAKTSEFRIYYFHQDKLLVNNIWQWLWFVTYSCVSYVHNILLFLYFLQKETVVAISLRMEQYATLIEKKYVILSLHKNNKIPILLYTKIKIFSNIMFVFDRSKRQYIE